MQHALTAKFSMVRSLSMRVNHHLSWLLGTLLLIACGGGSSPPNTDSGPGDAAVDSSADAAVDSGMDAAVDSGMDAAVDSGVDAAVDSGVDAGPMARPGSPGIMVVSGGASDAIPVSSSGAYHLRAAVGAPQPMGTATSASYVLSVGPAVGR